MTKKSDPEFDAVIEIPKGSRNKYEVDHDTGRIRLKRQLLSAIRYPADYGFIEGTLGEDGDPLDVLVLVDEPTVPGCLIRCRPVAVCLMEDQNGPDAKIVAVPADDGRQDGVHDLGDLPDHLIDEIAHFFDIYKDLEPGNWTKVGDWRGREDAVAIIQKGRKRNKKP